jgi:transcriptional regulator with XRE-family HTH domain
VKKLDRFEQAKQLKAKGLTITEIAREMGIAYSTARNYVCYTREQLRAIQKRYLQRRKMDGYEPKRRFEKLRTLKLLELYFLLKECGFLQIKEVRKKLSIGHQLLKEIIFENSDLFGFFKLKGHSSSKFKLFVYSKLGKKFVYLKIDDKHIINGLSKLILQATEEDATSRKRASLKHILKDLGFPEPLITQALIKSGYKYRNEVIT